MRVQALVDLRVAAAEAATRDILGAAEARVLAHLADLDDLGREQMAAARVWRAGSEAESRALAGRLDDLAAQITALAGDAAKERLALEALRCEVAALDARQMALDASINTDIAAMLQRLELIRRQTRAALQGAGVDG